MFSSHFDLFFGLGSFSDQRSRVIVGTLLDYGISAELTDSFLSIDTSPAFDKHSSLGGLSGFYIINIFNATWTQFHGKAAVMDYH